MNALTIINHDGVDAIDSRLVAEAIEKEHKNLLRDISGYIKSMEESGELKIEPSDFFIPSTYTSEQNKEMPCYLLTKKGCDMVANKMTGKKGVIFTAAYVTAFEDMRKHIEAPRTAMDMLKLQTAAIFELNDKVALIEDKLDNQMTIDHGQQRTLQQAVAKRVYERVAERFPAKEVKDRSKLFFQAIYRDIKNRFGVASYRDIRPTDYKDAIAYVESWVEPAALRS